jgi:U3 small nucleolar RNA-associated protein 11
MLSSSVDKRGLKVADRGNESLSTDVVKLLKTQDAAYIRTVLQQVRRERARLEEKLVLEEAGEVQTIRDGEETRQGVHRVFVGDEGEQEHFDADAWFGEGKSMPSASTPEIPREWESESENDDGDDVSEEGEEAPARPQKKTPSAKKIKEAEDKAKALKKFEKTRSRAQSRTAFRLQMVRKKERELVAAEEALEKQRAKMSSSVGGVNKNGVKFKIRERKR